MHRGTRNTEGVLLYTPVRLFCLPQWDLGFFENLARHKVPKCMTYAAFSYVALSCNDELITAKPILQSCSYGDRRAQVAFRATSLAQLEGSTRGLR